MVAKVCHRAAGRLLLVRLPFDDNDVAMMADANARADLFHLDPKARKYIQDLATAVGAIRVVIPGIGPATMERPDDLAAERAFDPGVGLEDVPTGSPLLHGIRLCQLQDERLASVT